MLGGEEESYESVEALAHLVLGIQSTSARLLALASVPRTDGREPLEGPLADALLGFVAFARTVRANFVRGAAESGDAETPAVVPAEAPWDFLR